MEEEEEVVVVIVADDAASPGADDVDESSWEGEGWTDMISVLLCEGTV